MKTLIIGSVLLMPILSFSQFDTRFAIAKKDTIFITVDKNGKWCLPANIHHIKLERCREYAIKIANESGREDERKKNFYKELAEQFKNVKDSLDAIDNRGMLTGILDAKEIEELKKEYSGIADSLSKGSGFSNLADEYKFFPPKKEWLQFEPDFKLIADPGALEAGAGCSNTCSDCGKGVLNEFDIQVKGQDPYKEFVRRYYNFTHASWVNGELNRIDSLTNDIKVLSKGLNDPKRFLECDEALRNMKQQIEGNFKKLTYKNWIPQWLWFTKMKVQLNPLPFTDENKLVDVFASDSLLNEKAKTYNEFVDHLIAKMKTTKRVDSVSMGLARMEYYLKSQGKGKEIFNNADFVKLIKEQNKKIADSWKQSNLIYNEIKLPLEKKHLFPDESNLSYLLFDADAQNPKIHRTISCKNGRKCTVLTGGHRRADILMAESRAYAAIYNIPSGNKIAYKDSVIALKDESNFQSTIKSIAPGVLDAANSISGIENKFAATVKSLEKASVPVIIPPKFNDGNKGKNKTGDNEEYMEEIFKQFPNASCLRNNFLYAYKNLDRQLDPSAFRRIFDSSFLSFVSALTKRKNDVIAELDSLNKKLLRRKDSISRLPVPFKGESSKSPLYSSKFELMTVPDKTSKVIYEIILSEKDNRKKDGKEKDEDEAGKIYKGYYKVGEGHSFAISAGVSYFTKATITNLVKDSSGIKVSSDDQQIRLFVGLHYYPWKMMNIDNRPIWSMGNGWITRMSVVGGVTFPDPLYNPNLGIAADLVPGLKLALTHRWYRYTSYKVLNDQIKKESAFYRSGGLNVSVTIDPVSAIVSIVNLFAL